jgi:transcriptional regulator with XRE-family HTH domain
VGTSRQSALDIELREWRNYLEQSEGWLEVALDNLRAAEYEFAKAEADVRDATERVHKAERQKAGELGQKLTDYLRSELKHHRERLNMRQEDLAAEMRECGTRWQRVTVAEVERGSRRVSIDELLLLAGIFTVPVIDLLVPDTAGRVLIEVREEMHMTISSEQARELIMGRGGSPGSREGVWKTDLLELPTPAEQDDNS